MPFRKAVLSLAALLLTSVPLALAQGTYTQIDYPGALDTVAYGINNAGDVVGGYTDSNNNSHGFLLSGGIYTTIDDPDVPGFAYGINDLGQIVGNDGESRSYLYDPQTQTFTNIACPNPQFYTVASSINNVGTVVGALHQNDSFVGFELRNGSCRIVTPTGSHFVFLYTINNLGKAVGISEAGGIGTNFFYVQGRSQPIRIPATSPTVIGINDVGAIAGQYYPSRGGQPQGFLYQNGTLQEIAFPGSSSGFVYQVNNSGEASGVFYDAVGNSHGFTWTPPADAAKK